MDGNITITRMSDGMICVSMRDKASGIKFVSAEMDCETFAMAVTGLAECECEIETHGLAHIGKKRVRESREIVCPIRLIDVRKDELQKWLEANAQEEGWILDSYLGSQSSTKIHPNGTLLRYSVVKYID